jgi:hypothetical protein
MSRERPELKITKFEEWGVDNERSQIGHFPRGGADGSPARLWVFGTG